ncbi:hypothetical protein L210DRAFT_3089659 [Boletus edulis BED1]|uniref:Uncharacterized protein n=1 Tax=Boletus edulis BED1 TaxID=1328754 RepID=A0AAD4BZF7_BOLED|nr:hypothetical protein L210DRAFT_3089659 [Boletus edulis BED1]
MPQPLKPFTLRRNLFLLSKAHVVTCPCTPHQRARRYTTEQPLFARHHAAPHISMSSGPPLSRFTPNHDEPSPPEQIPDLEWEIRTGRAIYILERTLPDFFQVGLVSHIDPTRPDIVDVAVSDESIYSPVIRLTYTPPVALPPPFPRTLSLEGLALYMASSVFIRHTMKTLYSDLRVEMRKLAVHTPSITAPPTDVTPSRRREKSLFVGLTVHGTTRVSGGTGEWQIDSTYGFSPASGLINLHTIDSIQPAPHQAAYDALKASLSQVFGIGGDMRPGTVR